VWLLNGTTMIGGGVVGSAGDLNWQLVGVGDVNGDSKADLVWRHLSTGQVAVWLLDGPTLAGAAVVGSAADLNWQLE
jgi:FG-GAP repeat